MLTSSKNYYEYKDDIARVAALGVKAYSFSLSWSRILPFGRGAVNQEAIDHYNDVINTCIEYGLIPQVTLYHWDTPLMLQDTYGGWLSENIVNDFVEYARIAFGAFGDRVDHWFTVNERKSTRNTIANLPAYLLQLSSFATNTLYQHSTSRTSQSRTSNNPSTAVKVSSSLTPKPITSANLC